MAATWPDADPPRRPGSRRDCETVDHAPLEPERGIDLLRREAMPALEVLAHFIEHVVRNGFAVGALEDHEGERILLRDDRRPPAALLGPQTPTLLKSMARSPASDRNAAITSFALAAGPMKRQLPVERPVPR